MQRHDNDALYEAGQERKPSRVRLGSSADESNGASGGDRSRCGGQLAACTLSSDENVSVAGWYYGRRLCCQRMSRHIQVLRVDIFVNACASNSPKNARLHCKSTGPKALPHTIRPHENCAQRVVRKPQRQRLRGQRQLRDGVGVFTGLGRLQGQLHGLRARRRRRAAALRGGHPLEPEPVRALSFMILLPGCLACSATPRQCAGLSRPWSTGAQQGNQLIGLPDHQGRASAEHGFPSASTQPVDAICQPR